MNIKNNSNFLMFRTMNLNSNCYYDYFSNKTGIKSSNELDKYLHNRVKEITNGKKAALALSGGIDSAILAKYMPEGSTAYTFKCIVPGKSVVDETTIARKYADACGLNHRIVEVYWDDMESLSNELIKSKGSPIHSIEVQIYKASKQAKRDGFDTIIFGESADAIYGGLSGLLSKDWLFGDFVERFSYIMPYRILKDSVINLEPFKRHEKKGRIDPYEFINDVFINESVGSYINATKAAQMDVCLPYAETYLDTTIDYNRIRHGENKYLVRELFARLYPRYKIPEKTPMPRPTYEWLMNWKGPERKEFWDNCIDGLSGDQKWMVYSLDKYLGLFKND